MINATMGYLRKGNETLFLYRHGGKDDIHNGLYVPPGGRIERGERGIDCVIREFREETGLLLLNPKLRAIVTFYNEGRDIGIEENPEDWMVETYEARGFTGTLKKEGPKSDPHWIKDEDLPKTKMRECDRRILEELCKEGVLEIITRHSGKELIVFEVERAA